MTEEFLSYIWRFKLLHNDLFTTQHQSIEIMDCGQLNTDSGPDFFNAKIKIDETIWAGNIELHVKSSDWLKHNHSTDKSYQNVILHVVYQDDVELDTQIQIPTLELKGKFDEALFFRYRNLLSLKDWVPCASQLKSIDDLILYSFLDRLLLERLERKVELVEKYLDSSKNHWESAFYFALARGFGFNVNAQPFEMLAKSLPIEILAKHKNSPIQIEALLFGQAGLLNKHLKDAYSLQLVEEYSYLKKKYSLEPLAGHEWKFMRMRPSNFPTIRISQFAQLTCKSVHLLSKVIETKKLSDLYLLFDVETSDYWKEHYTFGKKSKSSSKHLGQSTFDLILINTIVPFVFEYAKQNHLDDLRDRAILWLHQLSAEKNSIIANWIRSGIKVNHAAHSQALLTLKKEYCDNFKCLECVIGNFILRKNPSQK